MADCRRTAAVVYPVLRSQAEYPYGPDAGEPAGTIWQLTGESKEEYEAFLAWWEA